MERAMEKCGGVEWESGELVGERGGGRVKGDAASPRTGAQTPNVFRRWSRRRSSAFVLCKIWRGGGQQPAQNTN
jgi:hypothetical protein